MGMECRKHRSEKLYDDVLNSLPVDPFGMNLTTTLTPVSEWFKDIEKDLGSLGFICEGVGMKEDYVYTGLNLVLNSPAQVITDGRKRKIDEMYSMESHEGLGLGLGIAPCDGDGDLVRGSSSSSSSNMEEDSMCFGCEKYWVKGDCDYDPNSNDSEDGSIICVDDNNNSDGVCPHDAMLYALSYLSGTDLLNIEMVCKSFRADVRNDPLLWKDIQVNWPLNNRLTDDKLLWLTDRAQGKLQKLCLVECTRITIDGLRRVLESNSGLTKLYIPGCTALSIGSILSCLKSFKSSAFPGLKQLRLGGHHGLTMEQFEELNFLLGNDGINPVASHKPRFFGTKNLYLSCDDDDDDDDRPLDIELCPKCGRPRQVYDCPAESCQVRGNLSSQLCRACTFCIARCRNCGNCIKDSKYEETFCLDLLCLDCWEKNMNSQEEIDLSSSNRQTFLEKTNVRSCGFG